MELQQALEERYSCRNFTSEVPSEELVRGVLEAGRLAPTACNNQPQRIYVVQGQDNLEKLDLCTRCRYNAQVALIIGYDTTEAAVHDPERFGGGDTFSFGEHDAVSALVHMALKATDLGMATCWLGAINDDELHKQFAIPETVAIRAVLDLGFPGEKGTPSRMHTDRKPLEHTVSWV